MKAKLKFVMTFDKSHLVGDAIEILEIGQDRDYVGGLWVRARGIPGKLAIGWFDESLRAQIEPTALKRARKAKGVKRGA